MALFPFQLCFPGRPGENGGAVAAVLLEKSISPLGPCRLLPPSPESTTWSSARRRSPPVFLLQGWPGYFHAHSEPGQRAPGPWYCYEAEGRKGRRRPRSSGEREVAVRTDREMLGALRRSWRGRRGAGLRLSRTGGCCPHRRARVGEARVNRRLGHMRGFPLA